MKIGAPIAEKAPGQQVVLLFIEHQKSAHKC